VLERGTEKTVQIGVPRPVGSEAGKGEKASGYRTRRYRAREWEKRQNVWPVVRVMEAYFGKMCVYHYGAHETAVYEMVRSVNECTYVPSRSKHSS
jgi:hypothetical protein